MHLVPILIQFVCREDNEKIRNGRGKRRSENSRKDTEQFKMCRRHITNGRKKAHPTKLIRRPIFQPKEDNDYDNSRLGQV